MRVHLEKEELVSLGEGGERPVTADTMVPMGDREARPLSSCSWWSCAYLSIHFTLPAHSSRSRVRMMVLRPSTSPRLMHIDSFPQTSHHLHHIYRRRLSNILLQYWACEVTKLQSEITSYLEKIRVRRVETNNKNKNIADLLPTLRAESLLIHRKSLI